MSIEQMREMLMWCSVINVGLLVLSFLMMVAARPMIYKLHSKWFPMPEAQFNGLLYGILGGYKILVFVFNIVPWIALSLAGQG